MEDDRLSILNQSTRRISKLKLLSDFFENITLISIYVKTEIIHNLFKENSDLDHTKLELFHLQYTDSLINLVDKIKKSNERDFLNFSTEISTNNEFIAKYNQENPGENFDVERKYYSSNFSNFLKTMYEDLSSDRLTGNLEVFNFKLKYAENFYREYGNKKSLEYEDNKLFYDYQDIRIEKKLLGRLNIQNFKSKFVAGFILENNIYELFKIFQTDEFYVYNNEKKEIYLLPAEQLSDVDISTNSSKQKDIVEALKLKNKTLDVKRKAARDNIPNETLMVMDDYLRALGDVDIMNNILRVDEETNILKAMLNLNLNKS